MLKKKPEGMTKEASFAYYQGLETKEMFDVMETKIALPERARMFDSYECECCGETTGANWIRLQGDKKVCVDCFRIYDRFHV